MSYLFTIRPRASDHACLVLAESLSRAFMKLKIPMEEAICWECSKEGARIYYTDEDRVTHICYDKELKAHQTTLKEQLCLQSQY